ncbi:MAG: UPF0262 family protein [Alphaproteobacteria bacterium]
MSHFDEVPRERSSTVGLAISDVRFTDQRGVEVDAERETSFAVARFDVAELEAGSIMVKDNSGPFDVHINIEGSRERPVISLLFKNAADEVLADKRIEGEGFHSALNNYQESVDDFFKAVRGATKISAAQADENRRSHHNNTARELADLLAPDIRLTHDAAREFVGLIRIALG